MSCLVALDKKLVETMYLCGNKMTMGDIIVYNELSQFMELVGINPTSQELAAYPFLSKWFNQRMGTDEQIKQLDQEMKEALAKIKKQTY